MSPLRNRTTLALLSLPALLAACAVGPDYQRPATPLPTAFTSNTAVAHSESALIERQWWKLFADPTLDELVSNALANNADLRQAVARIEESDALMRQAGAALFPEIDGNLGSNHARSSQKAAAPIPAGYPVTQKNLTGSLGTTFELDFWGKLRRASEAARAQALASRYGKDTVELSLVGLVVQNYLSLRSLDAQVSVAKDSESSRDAALRIVNSRLSAGLASQLDLQQALTAQAASQAQSADLRRQRALAEHQLALLTGKLDLSLPPGDLRQLPLPPEPPAGLPSALLEGRPDVAQAEAQLVAANAKIGVAKAALFPTISLTGSVGSQSKDLANLFTSKAGTWAAGLGVFMPIFDAGRLSAHVDEVNAQQKQVAAAYLKTVQTAFKEVSDALVSADEYRLAEAAQGTQQEAARKTLALAEARYQAGYSRYLEVLDAQRSANDSSLAFIRSRQARLSTTVDLFKSLGGGWRNTSSTGS